MQLNGFHHTSSYSGHIEKSVKFYTQILGLRLVLRSVNQDDPTMYHLAYGDKVGSPGTILTFFDIPHAAPTRRGTNTISSIGLRVPNRDALVWWAARLRADGVAHDGIEERDGRAVLNFLDPDGQQTYLIADRENIKRKIAVPWNVDVVPADKAIRGIGIATLTVRKLDSTARVLTGVLGFRESQTYSPDGKRQIVVFDIGAGSQLHVEERADLPIEKLGSGGIHHIAFSTTDDAAIARWAEKITAAGYRNSGVVDRYFFQSFYFRDPNGILYELATSEGRGLAVNSGLEHLGETLELPDFLKPRREQIEAKLRPLPVGIGV